ncbi:MAG: DUF4389 domain-containing protein [Thermomicrobiales bacterium]
MQAPSFIFDVPYPPRLSRLMIFVKWLLVIPHLFVLWLLGFVVSAVTFVAWFAILITGRYPLGMWTFVVGVIQWSTRVSVYATYYLRDDYPPFGEGPYPMEFRLRYPDRLSRLLIFVKWLLVIPHILVLAVLGMVMGFTILAAWLMVLITAQYPQGLFRFHVGVLRWSTRVTLYAMLLTDDYPPFSLD